jgi:hypothetical protein
MIIRVPDTFQAGAVLPFSAFLTARKINYLHVFNNPEYSHSPASTILPLSIQREFFEQGGVPGRWHVDIESQR